MKLHVVGAGAIGGIVAAHLVRAGHQVTVIDANADHVEELRASGLVVSGATEIRVPVPALLPDEVHEPLGTVFLAVKARHTDDAMQTIAPLLRPDGYVVSLQNGLEEERIATSVGADRVVGALLTFGGFYEAPGHVRYAGTGSFLLGEISGEQSRRVDGLSAMFSRDFHPTEVTDNILGALWSKAALGSAYFATALVDEDVPVIFGWPTYRPVFERLVREAVTVARAEGIDCLPLDDFDPNAFADEPRDDARQEASWRAQAAYWHSHGQGRTGVWRDLAIHHRPTEVDWIVAPIVERAQRHGFELPVITTLVDLVHQAEAGRVRAGTDWLDDLLEVATTPPQR